MVLRRIVCFGAALEYARLRLTDDDVVRVFRDGYQEEEVVFPENLMAVVEAARFQAGSDVAEQSSVEDEDMPDLEPHEPEDQQS